MAITTEFLNGLNLSKEQVDAIFSERGKEIAESNKKISDLTSENKKLTDDFTALTSEKEELAKLAGDAEGYKTKIAEYEKAAAEKADAEAKAKADKDLTDKIEAVFGDKKFTSQYVHDGLIADVKKAFLTEGNTKGISEIFSDLTKNSEGIFANPSKNVKIPPAGGTSGNADDDDFIRRAMGIKPKT